MRRSSAELMLVTTVTLWALNFTVSKYLLTHGFEPLTYPPTRYFAATILFVAITRIAERTLAVRSRDLPLLLGCAVLLLVNQVTFAYALSFTTASTVALLFGILLSESLSIEQVVGGVAIACGIVIARRPARVVAPAD